jgi:hypothetical protein
VVRLGAAPLVAQAAVRADLVGIWCLSTRRGPGRADGQRRLELRGLANAGLDNQPHRGVREPKRVDRLGGGAVRVSGTDPAQMGEHCRAQLRVQISTAAHTSVIVHRGRAGSRTRGCYGRATGDFGEAPPKERGPLGRSPAYRARSGLAVCASGLPSKQRFTCVLGCGSNGDQRRSVAVGDDRRRTRSCRTVWSVCAPPVGVGTVGGRRCSPATAGNRRQVTLGSRALVAQGIEHRFPKPCVASSNLAGGTLTISRNASELVLLSLVDQPACAARAALSPVCRRSCKMRAMILKDVSSDHDVEV